MRTLNVPLEGRAYDILIGRGLLAEAGERCRAVVPKAQSVLIVTDDNVAPLYAAQVEKSLADAGLRTRVVVLPAGEETKCLAMLGRLYDELTDFGITRTDAVCALGGGVIGDLTGFAAATILRGIDFIQIPTTLLAMVDSSVGGKVAIDLPAGKNLAGAFWQPKLVLADPDVLSTLPDREFSAGMAEVIKYGCIRDAKLFDLLEECGGKEKAMAHIEEIIEVCCGIKRDIVLADERDTGERRLLNYGHTLGHAIELAGNYETHNHGEGVAVGICMVNRIGEELKITSPETSARIKAILEAYNLPAAAPCPQSICEKALKLDKKSEGSNVALILIDEIGTSRVEPITRDRMLELVRPLLDKE